MKLKKKFSKIVFPLFSILLFSNNSANSESLVNILDSNEKQIIDEVVLVKTGRYKEAILKLQTKLVDFPNNPSIYYYLGKAYEKDKNIVESIKNYNKSTEIDPNYAKPYMAIALLKGKQNNLKETIEFLDKAISADPKYAKAFSNRGVAKGALSDNSGAIDDFTKALKIDPLMTEAYVNRGITYELLGNIKLACSDWKSAKSLGNESVGPWFDNQCKNIPLDEINLAATNSNLLNEIKYLKETIEKQEKALNNLNKQVPLGQLKQEPVFNKVNQQVSDSEVRQKETFNQSNQQEASTQVKDQNPQTSQVSLLKDLQIGVFQEDQVTAKILDNSPQGELNNINPEKELSSIEKAKLKLASVMSSQEEQSSNSNLDTSLNSLELSTSGDDVTAVNIQNLEKKVEPILNSSELSTSGGDVTAVNIQNLETKAEPILNSSELSTSGDDVTAANIKNLKTKVDPILNSSELSASGDDVTAVNIQNLETKVDPILNSSELSTLGKQGTTFNEENLLSNNNADKGNTNKENIYSIKKDPIKSQSVNNLGPLDNNFSEGGFDRLGNQLSKYYSNQLRDNNLSSNISTFSLGFFMATTVLLLLDKMRGLKKNQNDNSDFYGSNILLQTNRKDLADNRDMSLELKETNKLIDKSQYLINTLNEQKLIIENKIKILNLDLDFLKIKQSNLKVYCLSKYKNEIDNINEYNCNSKFYSNENKKGSISLGKEFNF